MFYISMTQHKTHLYTYRIKTKGTLDLVLESLSFFTMRPCSMEYTYTAFVNSTNINITAQTSNPSHD